MKNRRYGHASSNIVEERAAVNWWRSRWSVGEYLVVGHQDAVSTQCASTLKENKGQMCVCRCAVYRVSCVVP